MKWMKGRIRIHHCDMFSPEGLSSLQAHSISAIITDFPYGTTCRRDKRNEWDDTIDFAHFWDEANRIRVSNAPVVSTAIQPFTSYLISTNLKEFKYTWVWEKSKASGYMNAKRQPMRAHEDIVVFYQGQCVYNPQMTEGKPYNKGTAVRDARVYNRQDKAVSVVNESGLRYPRTVLYFATAEKEGGFHPTQKPVALMEYLIRTYTSEGDTVLDPCMGSGTTGIACLRTNRRFIGFESDGDFYRGAKKRFSEEIAKNFVDAP